MASCVQRPAARPLLQRRIAPSPDLPAMDHALLITQRTLRHQLFEGPRALRWRPARELAAQLLLYLDDPQACWRITTEWLRDTLDADRVDGGYGGFLDAAGQPSDYVVLAEAQRNDLPLPPVLGLRFRAVDPSLRAVWAGRELAAIEDVAQARSFTRGMRGTLLALGTSAKLALPLRDGAQPLGLVCADWHRATPRWHAGQCNQLGELARDALGPLLGASARLAAAQHESPQPALPLLAADSNDAHAASPPEEVRPPAWCDLTPAELRVARLVATGLSYKEVAQRLDRSLSTVDHQLRALRDKLGVRSTARLVHLLNAQLQDARR